jgi:hypothetical protein
MLSIILIKGWNNSIYEEETFAISDAILKLWVKTRRMVGCNNLEITQYDGYILVLVIFYFIAKVYETFSIKILLKK